MSAAGPSRRLLLVHAHPDDETIGTGATMARYAAEGVGVTLVTCTLGDEGEILVPGLAQLAADAADQLGGWRISELDAAMRALGVRDHRFLGGAGRFRDSGMIGSDANAHPRAFWRAANDRAVFDEAVQALVEVIREVRPHVVVTYDDNGDYGHPDHVMAHRVTTAAVETARPDWTVAKTYWTATPRSLLQQGSDAMRSDPDAPFTPTEEFTFGVDDDDVTTVIDGQEFIAAKAAALAAHATQISVTEPYFALSNGLGRTINAVEHFRLVHGTPGGERDADGRETDLFAGIEL